MSARRMGTNLPQAKPPLGGQANTPPAAVHGADEPRPWLTAEDSAGWRARARPQGTAPKDGGTAALHHSVLVELDGVVLAWLDRRAAESGLTLAGCVKKLIEEARATAEKREPI